jgi:DNA-binding NarL/FixJ family response regulator
MVDSIRVFIVDDQALIRDGLKSLLLALPDIDVVGDAANGAEAIAQLQTLAATSEPLPNIILLDIRMPVMDGIATTQQVRSQFPTVNVLILTTFDDDADVAQAMRAGAHGYLLKDTPSKDLAIAIRSIHQGYSYLGPGLMEKALAIPLPQKNRQNFPELTPREQEILQVLGTGANNREIAAQLFISERTVKNHVTNILSRLGLRDRTQAALYVQKQNTH